MATPPINYGNIYNYFVIEEWEQDEKNGFSYVENYDLKVENYIWKNGEDDLHEQMLMEFSLDYDNFSKKRSCMWVNEVKRRAKWVRGETLYGYSREKHDTYPIWWSRDKKEIGVPTWILEADGYVSLSFTNGYTNNETEDTKYTNYIRPSCIYNDENCEELINLKLKEKFN